MNVSEPTAEKTSSSIEYDQSWAELIRRMAKGDDSSLAEFYEQSSRLVFGLVLRTIKQRALAEAALIEIYREAWRQARNFDPQRQPASDWIWTLASQQARYWLRVAPPAQPAHPLPESATGWGLDETPQETFMFDEQRQRIRRALSQLEQPQRALIECALFEGLTHHEIATKFSLSPLDVKHSIGSGMSKLRDLIFSKAKHPQQKASRAPSNILG